MRDGKFEECFDVGEMRNILCSLLLRSHNIQPDQITD